MTTQASPGLNVPSPYAAIPGLSKAPFVTPNGNASSGQTVKSAVSDGTIPANVQVTGAGFVPAGIVTAAGASAAGGRTLMSAMADAGRNGEQTQAYGVDSLNSDANGGNSLGAGGSNQTEGPSSGEATNVAGQTPANLVTYQNGAAAPIFGG
jgi:hypothetical protein